MQAVFEGPGGSRLPVTMPFEDFLATRPMLARARTAMCRPEELLFDFVPEDVDRDDEDEVAAAFGEACVMATDHRVENVALDRGDLRFIREHLMPGRGWRLLPAYGPRDAA